MKTGILEGQLKKCARSLLARRSVAEAGSREPEAGDGPEKAKADAVTRLPKFIAFIAGWNL